MATLRAGLTRERGRYLFNADTVLAGLVREQLLEFSERPVVHLTLHLVVPIIHSLADMGQTFDGDVRTIVGVGFLHDASINRVQAIQHEAVFSPRQSPEYLLGGASAFVLKASTHAEVVLYSAAGFYQPLRISTEPSRFIFQALTGAPQLPRRPLHFAA